MEFFRYTGDVKKLKSLGYTFQKLYARNYISYHKDEIFMFKTNKMILEIGNLDPQYQSLAIQFILDHKDEPETFWWYKSRIFKNTLMPVWSLIDGKIYNKEMKREEYKNGNEEIAFKTGFLFSKDRVEQILALQPLEKIKS